MYQITITQQDKTIQTTQPIKADNALAAIAQVERQYTLKAQSVKMGDEVVKWNGFEFMARRVNL